MPRRLIALAVSLTLAAAPVRAAAPVLAAQSSADPALWVVRDADTTLYLFGTLHFLPKDLTWFAGSVSRAFQASQELTLELLTLDNPAALEPLIVKLAVDPSGRRMAQSLTPEEHAAYVQGWSGSACRPPRWTPWSPSKTSGFGPGLAWPRLAGNRVHESLRRVLRRS